MRPLLLLLLAVLASGCGFSSGEPMGCDIDGLEVEAFETVDCGALSENVALARQLTGHMPKGYKLIIRNDFVFAHPDGQRYTGYWNSEPKEITLGRRGESLAHEFLHDLDFQNGVLNTGEHPGWVTNGYGRIDEDFKQKVGSF